MKINGVLVDTVNQTIKEHVVDYKSVEDYYKILNCNIFSTLSININGVNCLCYFDDIGKMRSDRKPIPSILMINYKTYELCDFVVGNVFICKFDGIDDDTSLSDDEISKILDNVTNITDENSPKVLISYDDYISYGDLLTRF